MVNMESNIYEEDISNLIKSYKDPNNDDSNKKITHTLIFYVNGREVSNTFKFNIYSQ